MKLISALAVSLLIVGSALPAQAQAAFSRVPPSRVPVVNSNNPANPHQPGEAQQRPNGHGCRDTRYAAECFTTFLTRNEAQQACRTHMWDPYSYAYIEAQKYLCAHERVQAVN